MKHKHDFRVHVGVRTSFGALAWLLPQFVQQAWGAAVLRPQMWRCVMCGEQGYGVSA